MEKLGDHLFILVKYMEPQFPLKRPRGRPRKQSIDPLMEIRMQQRLKISSMMDIKIYDDHQIKDEPILSRSQKKVEDLPIDTKGWDQFNAQIKTLLQQYREDVEKKVSDQISSEKFFKEIDNKLKLEENELSEDDILKDEESCNEINDSNVSPNSRKAFMLKKPPLTDFYSESVKSLPEEAQRKLEENRDKIFKKGITYQEQIEAVIKLIYSPNKKDHLGQTAISKLFGITKGAINTHFQRMGKPKRSIVGRPPLLDEFQSQSLCEYISFCYGQKQSPSIFTLSDFIYNKFQLYLAYHSIYNYVQNSKSLKTVLAPVYESVRAEVELDDIKEYYQQLDHTFICEKIPPSFVFNIDESGFIDFIDMRDEIVVVPVNAPEGTVKGAERNSKRATMIGGIALDGTKLTPCIVLANKRCEKELIINGYGNQNVLLVYQENGFINSKIFSYWTDHIFIPELNRRREIYGYQGLCVLLLDGCTPHASDYFLDECTAQKVYPFFEPAGSSDQVQALDLGIFGIQKGLKTRIKTKANFGPSSKQVQQIVNSWQQITTPDVVTSAFNQAGIYIEELKDGSFIARASIEKARAVRNTPHTECKNLIQGNKTVKLVSFDE